MLLHHPHLCSPCSTLTPNKHGRACAAAQTVHRTRAGVHVDRTLTSPEDLYCCCTVGKPGRQASKYTFLQISPSHPAMRAGFTEQLNTRKTIDVSILLRLLAEFTKLQTAGKITSAGPCVTRWHIRTFWSRFPPMMCWMPRGERGGRGRRTEMEGSEALQSCCNPLRKLNVQGISR